jgi:hypothetical protein
MQGDLAGHQPHIHEFMETCAALMHPGSEFLLAQEPRASEVRSVMLRELQRWFAGVEVIPSSAWSCSIRGCDHIEFFRATKKLK